ncbi:hypothetical protein [Massilia sp.]|uniref:hypothetical protein n=1 Tax=Massilia sp. TaxID=1882437 RepID=UPI0028ADDCF1|nr:hypothetical protein [Massilia sp.]
MKTIFASARMRQACGLAFAAVVAGQAHAAEPVLLDAPELGSLPALEDAKAFTAMPTEIKETPNIGGETVHAVDLERLDHERGKADTVLNDTKLNGDVANNSAVNVNTGSNTIDAGSFANMSGIPVVIQNSGANVLIQNATVINLQFQ